MALFDKVGRISDVPDGDPFLLIDYKMEMMNTQYGERECVFLRISKDAEGKSEPFWIQGFSAGLRSQLRNSDRSDFPVWVKFDTTEGGRGRSGTRIFVPADNEQLPLDDDIPF